MEINIKNRQKLLVIVVAVILGLFVADSVIFEPLLASWDARNKSITQLKAAVTRDNALLRKRTSILAHWDRMKTSALPMNSSLAGSKILQEKDKWVANSGVTPDDFSPQLKTDTDQDSTNVITTWECRTDASSDNVRSLLSFLWQIESDPMGLQLEDVEISSKDNNGQEMSLGLTMSALVLDNGNSQSQ